MSIQDVRKDDVEQDTGLDIADLDLSPLFVEPQENGMIAKFLPWVTAIGIIVVLVVLIIKI